MRKQGLSFVIFCSILQYTIIWIKFRCNGDEKDILMKKMHDRKFKRSCILTLQAVEEEKD